MMMVVVVVDDDGGDGGGGGGGGVNTSPSPLCTPESPALFCDGGRDGRDQIIQ